MNLKTAMDSTPTITVSSKLFFLIATIAVIIAAIKTELFIENLLSEINNSEATRAVKMEIGIYFKNLTTFSFKLIFEINITGSILGSSVTAHPPRIIYQIFIFPLFLP